MADDGALSLHPVQAESALIFSALVDGAGRVLAGVFPDGQAPDHLAAVLRPPGAVPFAAWWAGVCQGAQEHSPQVALACFDGPDAVCSPVRVQVTPVAGRDEALVLCIPAQGRQRSLIWALHHISLALSRTDLDRLLRIVRSHVLDLLPATTFYIGLYDQEAEALTLREAISHGEPVGIAEANPHEGLIGWVLATGLSLHIRDIQRDPLPAPYVTHSALPLSHSGLLVPLAAHGEMVGVLSVQHVEPHMYTDEDLWLLEAVASQAAVAIHEVYLGREAESRSHMLTFLQDFSLQLAASPRLPDVARVLADALVTLAAPDEVRVYLRSQQGSILDSVYRYNADGNPPFTSDWQHSMDPVAATVDREAEPVVMGQLTRGTRGLVYAPWQPGALAAYPIRRGDQPLGAVIVLYKEPHLFRQDEQRALSLISRQTAIAVEWAHYYADLAQRFEQVAALYALAQQVTGTLDDRDILQLVVHTLRDIFRCRACVIALRVDDTDEIAIRAAVGVKAEWRTSARFAVGEGVAGRVVETGKPIYVADVHASSSSLIFDPEVHSVIAVPIAYKDRVIGSLNLDSVRTNAFSPSHERILTIAASQIAAALEIARLYQQAQERAEKLAAANAELQHMERVREELIQNLSHELRTPLTYIKGYGSLLQDHDLGPLLPEQSTALKIILEKADTIQRLIHDVVLLEQISPETLDREPADFDTLIRQAFQTVQVLHSAAPLTFSLQTGAPGHTVSVDRGRLNQALDNLVNNAVKFTPEGGEITISTGVVEGGVSCTVRDTGIGISPEHLSRIFDRFYQVRDPARKGAGGSGIGLAIVRRVIEAHGGTITAESVPGEGSAFTLLLPAADHLPAAETPPGDDPPPEDEQTS